jgi:hypothetical protein
MKNARAWEFVVSSIVLSLAGACSLPTSPDVEEASELRHGRGFSISACCRRAYPPGWRRGHCIAQALRDHGICAPPGRPDAGACDAGPGGHGGDAGGGGGAGSGGGGAGSGGGAGVGGAAGSSGGASGGGAAGSGGGGAGIAGGGGAAGSGGGAGIAGGGGNAGDGGGNAGGGGTPDGGVDASADADAPDAACSSTALPARFECNSRPQSTCGSCLQALAGGDQVCACMTSMAKTNCQALLSCMAPVFFSCALSPGVCYCSDASCSSGANGPCAPQFHAVAGTTDPAQVLEQLRDPSATVSRLVQEGKRFASTAACGMYCGCL